MTAEKITVYINTPIERTVTIFGRLAEWLMQRTANPCTSVQFRYRPPLITVLFRLSSAVEQSAVNRLVACSNQAAGANKKDLLHVGLFFCSLFACEQATPVKNQLEDKNNNCSCCFYHKRRSFVIFFEPV